MENHSKYTSIPFYTTTTTKIMLGLLKQTLQFKMYMNILFNTCTGIWSHQILGTPSSFFLDCSVTYHPCTNLFTLVSHDQESYNSTVVSIDFFNRKLPHRYRERILKLGALQWVPARMSRQPLPLKWGL